MTQTAKLRVLLLPAALCLLAQGAAGQITCSATSVPPIVRAEGLAERLGDIVLQCTLQVIGLTEAGSSGQSSGYVSVNIAVNLNTTVTNNRNFGQGSSVTDAILVTNENNAQTPSAESVLGGPNPSYPLPQFGVLAASNRIEWTGVLFPIPGVGNFPGITTLRITGVRGNQFLLGSKNPLNAVVSIGSQQASILVTNNTLTLGLPIPAAGVEYRDGEKQGPAGIVTTLQCESQNISTSPFGGASFNGPPTFHARVSEGFATALRPLGSPSFGAAPGDDEAGYFAPGSGASNGGATQGSRLLARFYDIPAGIRLAVPSQVETGGLLLGLVDDADSVGAGGVLTGASGVRELSTDQGFGFVTYEVISADPVLQETADIPVIVGYLADVANGLPSTNQTMKASVVVAPISVIQTSDPVAPEPRFHDTSGDPVSIFRVLPCGDSQQPLTITTASPLPVTSAAAFYNVVLEAAGGVFPYSWSENSPFNPLPSGLSLSPAGVISGTPSAAGSYSVGIRVTDAARTPVARTFGIVVNDALTILTISPSPAARVQEPYGGTFLATGGVAPYTWAIVGGSFPSALNFDTQTGTISGTLTEPVTAVFTVRVSGSMGAMFDKDFSLPVSIGPPPVIITETSLPQATVGGTYMTRLDAEMGVAPYRWGIVAGALPPGLTLDPASGEIAGMPARAGEFGMTALVVDAAGETGLKKFSLEVVPPPQELPRLSVDPPRLLTAFVPGSPPRRRALLVSNPGRGSLNFDVNFSTKTGGDWLSVSPSGGSAMATQPAALFVTVDPAGTGPGTYFGAIEIESSASGKAIWIPVVMAISGRSQLLRLSRKGMTFTAVSGGGGTLPQRLRVLNDGAGTLNWSMVPETTSGGPDWLTAAPAMGSTEANSASAVAVAVQPGDLPPGSYYGFLRVLSPGAASSPRFTVVALNLLPPGADTGLIVDPIGLLFAGETGGPLPAARTIGLSNPSTNPVAVTSRRLTVERSPPSLVKPYGGEWFTHSPDQVVVGPGETIPVSVQPNLAGLEPGVYRGFIPLSFSGRTRTVRLNLIVREGSGSPAPARLQGTCVPATLVLELTSNSGGLPVSAGWPASIGVTVLDNCQQPMVIGNVTTSFSNGHAPLVLEHAGEGLWDENVNFSNSETGPVVLTIAASMLTPGDQVIDGQITRNLEVLPNPEGPPILTAGGVVHAASFENQPLAAGTIFSIFGEGLSERKIDLGQPFGGGALAASLPLSSELGGTRIIFAGQGSAPLLFSREDQVNAIAPFGLDVNEERDIYVQRGSTLSSAVSVNASQVTPAAFTQFGTGIGPASIQTVDGALVSANNPVSAGDVVIIFGAGLGEVSPPIEDGHASCEPDGVCLSDGSNLILRSVVSKPAVTVGGVPISVFFAGLSPSFAGLYQINATLPEGVPAGDAEVKISFGGFDSPDGVTIRVE